MVISGWEERSNHYTYTFKILFWVIGMQLNTSRPKHQALALAHGFCGAHGSIPVGLFGTFHMSEARLTFLPNSAPPSPVPRGIPWPQAVRRKTWVSSSSPPFPHSPTAALACFLFPPHLLSPCCQHLLGTSVPLTLISILFQLASPTLSLLVHLRGRCKIEPPEVDFPNTLQVPWVDTESPSQSGPSLSTVFARTLAFNTFFLFTSPLP